MRRILGTLLVVSAVSVLIVACSSSDDGSTTESDADAGGAVRQDSGASINDAAQDTSTLQDATTDGRGTDDGETGAPPGTFTLRSTSFAQGASIPARHGCAGSAEKNVSPALAWENAPSGTQSYAVVMRDLFFGTSPDANNYHWVIYDIPADATSLPEAITPSASPPIPAGAKQTYWSFGPSYSYLGPCPPSGVHEYEFTVYAFPTPTLDVPANTTDPKVADAVIQTAKTASASLSGTYSK
ncbi:hypothetical protein AKJ09_00287 [Labilithrix luteola]|uniref:Phospholipid-binding protein n=1 Tax=Labilithrix luteola TaxID=1391654 RepID=A0A0K1PJA3_9BACT|nr:YbhB/YbcL family Raf kinase inhibitor-like protein [Labilithrix luteola]AKU93623.1 hypothetical protein AKJ09_00287 [Labilithrix luteola]